LVEELYWQYLGRAADAGGEGGWISALQNGGTEEQVIAGLCGSDEFYNRAGKRADAVTPSTPDATFARALYVSVLGRTGSTAEVSSWVSQVPMLGRAGVVTAFLSSGEY